MGTGRSVIVFINSETPLLNLPIPRIAGRLNGVKKQVAYFLCFGLNEPLVRTNRSLSESIGHFIPSA